MKHIIDISWPISQKSTEYKDRKSIVFESMKTFEKDGIRETMLHFHAHSGTHIDMPAHFLEKGEFSDRFMFEKLVNAETTVLDLTFCEDAITKSDLQRFDLLITKNTVILLKTKNSALAADAPFYAKFIYLTSDAALYLAEKKISVVGIDYLGIERNQPGHPTHKTLLQNGIIIIEGLRLAAVKSGNYQLSCLPLSISGIDAIPARAILIQK